MTADPKTISLHELVANTNKTYNLGLDLNRTVNRLRAAGFSSEVAGGAVSRVIDFLTNTKNTTPSLGSAYAAIKKDVTAASEETCPIDHSRMDKIQLVNSREAYYCKSCNVTLPVKVQ